MSDTISAGSKGGPLWKYFDRGKQLREIRVLIRSVRAPCLEVMAQDVSLSGLSQQ